MQANRSMPACTVIPILRCADIDRTIDWLGGAFGFTKRWQVGSHRAQLRVGAEGCVILAQSDPTSSPAETTVRVADVDAHHARAAEFGAQIVGPPADYPYGERQYSVEDPDGHRWTFSQSIRDLDPTEWGATVGDLDPVEGPT